MCGGFTCLKNTLTALNVLYVVVSFILIGVAAYGIASSGITSLKLVGGIIACGVFLFLLSLLGLIGTVKHNQVLLFFYMIILFLLFIVQFAIACACLAFNEGQQHQLALEGWHQAPMPLRNKTQIYFGCCEFEDKSLPDGDPMKGPPCQPVSCCQGKLGNCSECPTCWKKLQDVIGKSLKISGGVGLFFSFTEIVAVWLTHRYRLQKNPQLLPYNHFL